MLPGTGGTRKGQYQSTQFKISRAKTVLQLWTSNPYHEPNANTS